MENTKPKVHYLSLYCIPEFKNENRRHSPSAQKMDYIVKSLNACGYEVNFVSFSESKDNRIYFSKKKKLSKMTTFFMCPHIPGKFRESFSFRWFVHIYAKRHIKKGDTLLVYHTNGMRNDLLRRLADKMSLEIVYEVEEIYSYAQETVLEEKVEEEIEFLQCADKYLFCSELLEERVNRRKRPYKIVEGYYKYSKADVDGFMDGKIHCVYGGIIDKVKGGAFRAVEAAKYLPNNYVIHILGFGNSTELVERINQTKNERRCEVIYEGKLNGSEYINFISKCDIGLSLMTMREDINSTAFPSKLVLYMACGLQVVACRVKVLEISKLSKALNFYDTDSPEEIARVIQKIDVSVEYSLEDMMFNLDKEFKESLLELLS